MPLPMPGFMNAEWRNYDFNQVKTVNDAGTFYFFEISHSRTIDTLFLLFRESCRRSGACSVTAGFYFNKYENAAIAGDYINFTGFDFVISAKNLTVFSEE